MNNILGISAGFHDAAVTVIDRSGNILFAAHSERYSKVKNDSALHMDLLAEGLSYGIDSLAFFERPWMHNLQQWWSQQKHYGAWRVKDRIRELAPPEQSHDLLQRPAQAFPHHLSHAAAGFQTSRFDSAAVVVIDAIGELDTISIYRAWYDQSGRAQYKRLWRQGYPHSIGLFYSAVTAAVGLKPMDEEYITMGMAAYGSDHGRAWLQKNFIADADAICFSQNLHIGFTDGTFDYWCKESLAASAQSLTEELIMSVMRRAAALTKEPNLVYMGGVALNCVANRRLGQIFDRTWIMPNPGDAGSSLGAAALAHGGRLSWKDAYLGHCIQGDYPVKPLLDHLISAKIVGVASGPAEFGPRALGNRSLLADPRGPDIKDRVNEIKRRQKFRPFAPVILAEMVNEYFDMPHGWTDSDYMQVVARCRRPDLFPAICHYDGTSRVQTVPRNSRSGIRRLLESWFVMTGCPMLLNTSLNIRGEPMVNDRADADRFEKSYDVKVLS
jgi:carbamoyltransferase